MILLALASLALGYAAGWIRRGRTMPDDTLTWWNDGFKAGQRAGLHAGLTWFGLNPQHKPTRVATLDELTGERE